MDWDSGEGEGVRPKYTGPLEYMAYAERRVGGFGEILDCVNRKREGREWIHCARRIALRCGPDRGYFVAWCLIDTWVQIIRFRYLDLCASDLGFVDSRLGCFVFREPAARCGSRGWWGWCGSGTGPAVLDTGHVSGVAVPENGSPTRMI